LAGLVVATAFAAWTAGRALRIDPVPPIPPPTVALAGGVAGTATRKPADLQDAVDNDPFSPDRTPGQPYRLPGEPDPRSADPVVEPEKPVLLGTAVSADGRSFAVLQMGDGRAVSRYVGDTIGVYKVRTIDRARVVLASPTGKRVDVNAAKPEL
jgi:hypothetical protein